jgi:hypothetical protein
MKSLKLLSIFITLSLLSCTSVESVPVLIIGGGASGVSAGIQSSRMDVEAMIIEETPWLGGMLTSAGVSCIDGNYQMRSGIFGSVTDSLAARYGGYPALQTGWVSNINFDPHIGQEVFTNMTEACSDLLTVHRNSSVLSIRKENESWTVAFLDAEGRKRKVQAEVLIDATELGDVAKECGVEYRIGMESSADTGESIAPAQANDVIQDLTYVAFLKDYGPDADMTIDRPEGYDPSLFADSCLNPLSDGVAETGQTVWSPEMMISYGKTPGGRYMINWPIYGNDFYTNVIDASKEERDAAFQQAKNFTLCFVYFIQTQLGMKNLGIADDVFPTENGLPFFPYHRESRRIVGEAFFTMDAAAKPYEYASPYYRTGIAVGDYAVDHHHFRHPEWKSLPDLEFYPVPSFNVPMGVMIPKQKEIEDLIVAEKSVSVSNIINGATRLQPVVMQLGQAAGTLAAIACEDGRSVRRVAVRQVQQKLLEAGCYIMPYLDLPKDHRHFKALQRIGATGLLKGEGRNVGWANQTWFRAGDPLLVEELYVEEFYRGPIDLTGKEVSVGQLLGILRGLGAPIPASSPETWWNGLGLENYDQSRTVTRLETAVMVDATVDLFSMFHVDYEGNLKR